MLNILLKIQQFIGVTNPFFTKCFQHWPNIIRISENSKSLNQQLDNPSEENKKSSSSPTESSPTAKKSPKIKKTTNIKVVDNKPAVYSRYEPFLKKDKEILKAISKGTEINRPYEAQSTLLRKYFVDLTQSFMIPLERYFSTLMPLQKSITPFKSIPNLKSFDPNEFLRNLKQAGPDLTPTLKGDWAGLYKRFFDSLNFKHWYRQKVIEAEKKLEILQLELLCDYDVNMWLKNKLEIEIIDQYMNLKKKMDLIETCKIDANEQIKSKLKSIMRIFLTALPEDVRSIL